MSGGQAVDGEHMTARSDAVDREHVTASYDVHAHCIPADIMAALETGGDRLGVEVADRDGARRLMIGGKVSGPPMNASISDLPARLRAMDAGGVQVQLVSSWIDLAAYTLPASQGMPFARMFNESLAQMIGVHPDRFRGLCMVPLQAPEQAAAELRHAVGDLGMVGAEIGTTVAGRELDDRDLDPFWAAASELGCLLLVHPFNALAGRRVERHFLGNLVANPAESTIAIAHMVFGGVLDRYPDLKVCVVHGGGFLPYQVGRLERGYVARPALTAVHLRESPRATLRRLYYDTVLHDPMSLAALIAFAGVEHVVLGSDYPFEMGDPDPIATVTAVPGLSDTDRALILSGNVERLLGHLLPS
jgi:aminocarboxymuconate-semialdehyde decarboxylase